MENVSILVLTLNSKALYLRSKKNQIEILLDLGPYACILSRVRQLITLLTLIHTEFYLISLLIALFSLILNQFYLEESDTLRMYLCSFQGSVDEDCD